MIDIRNVDFNDSPGRRRASRAFVRDESAVDRIDVSVITPYYNTEEFFSETFVSLQGQSFQNWEWIIVDDGSTDLDAIERLSRVAESDSRIKVIRQENAGPSAARNMAFNHSKGQYICLLDSDDMLEPTYIEKCIWFLESNNEFAFCNSFSVVFGEQEYLWTTGFERGSAHVQANSGPPISVIRRSAFLDCGGFDESIKFGHEDWDFWLSMARAGHWGYTIPEYLQWYRKRAGGRFEQIMSSGNVNRTFEKEIQDKYSELTGCFPTPSRKIQTPFESIITDIYIQNPLVGNYSGRRIMFIIPWMVTGGADRVNLDLIEGLSNRGHDVTICATLSAVHNWESEFSRFTQDIFVLPNLLSSADFPRFLIYLIQSRKIDTVVVTGSTTGYQLLPYLNVFSSAVSFVDMCHVEEPNWLNGGHPRFGVGYQDFLNLNIVTTRHLSDWMVDRGADRSQIHVMYTGVRAISLERSVVFRKMIRSELNISDDIPVIVFAGRMCAQKRPEILAKILNGLKDRGLRFQSLIIGDGDHRPNFEQLIKQYGLVNHVKMLGSVDHQRWLDILTTADILLMPSEYEGISITLLESMAAGVVPVVALVGGQEEIVDPQAGMLIPHSDTELQDYLDALGYLLSNPADLASMSEQCRLIAFNRLSWSGMIDRFQSLLDVAESNRVASSRILISPRFAIELTKLSLDYNRLGEEFHYYRHHEGWSGASNRVPSNDEYKVAYFFVLLYRTSLGQWVSRKKIARKIAIFIKNKLQR